MVLSKYREDKQTLTKYFYSPIFDTLAPAKLDACSAACAYIINNFWAKLELPDNNTLPVDSGSEGDQSNDEDPNVKNMLDPPRNDGIPEGEPPAI